MDVQRSYLTSREVEVQQEGSTRLAPGFWIDKEGHAHISVPELLAVFALRDTPENRERMVRIIMKMLNSQMPDGDVVIQELR